MIPFCKFLCCAVVKIAVFNQMNDKYYLAVSYSFIAEIVIFK